MPVALRITLSFPRGVYSGSELGAPEELPSPSRVYEAFVAAAAGGPRATRDERDERVLIATDEDRAAVAWLEDNEPLGLVPPPMATSLRSARRYRWRAGPKSPVDTDFEPHSALGGPIELYWPSAPNRIISALNVIATEVTHVGKAECCVIARVDGPTELPERELLRVAPGRGPGRVMRIAVSGRFEVLEGAYARAMRPGRHSTGSLGKQAPDELVTGANESAVELRRFAPAQPPDWPYAEVLVLEASGAPQALGRIRSARGRVAAAVGVHRALVAAIGEDVPMFVTGRDGEGPLRGAGHLAIHLVDRADGGLDALLALPPGVTEGDRAQLIAVLQRPVRIGTSRSGARHWFTIANPRPRAAVPFWPPGRPLQTSLVPVVLEATGGPRSGGWTLDDALVCSVGYAMRGVLEREGFEWARGWAFRKQLVDLLRNEHGVDARARRVRGPAGAYLHRAPEGTLVVAVNAVVSLGRLDPSGSGLLALGRARHLGGGLLRPTGSQ